MPFEELTHVGCAREGCGHTICLTKATERRLRESHETFYCPSRHSN
jgi:hypothetical protein